MDNLAKIDIDRIKLGVRFSEPVYFEDGTSMFLAAGKAVKQYHLQALKQWNIPCLLSAGTASYRNLQFFAGRRGSGGIVRHFEKLIFSDFFSKCSRLKTCCSIASFQNYSNYSDFPSLNGG